MTSVRPERGLLMTGPLVLQTIAGAKTETRRIGDRYRKWKRGDRIYVRETYRAMCRVADPDCYCDDEQHHWVEYKADTGNPRPGDWPADDPDAPHWKPSIHMPKWAARVWLELVEDVAYEPLQDITEDGAKAEGVTVGEPMPATVNGVAGEVTYFNPRVAFAHLWSRINGKRGPADDPERFTWARNPEVVVLRFRVVSTDGRQLNV